MTNKRSGFSVLEGGLMQPAAGLTRATGKRPALASWHFSICGSQSTYWVRWSQNANSPIPFLSILKKLVDSLPPAVVKLN